MAEPTPAHLSWTRDRDYRGETLRVALPLGTLDPATVAALDFALELETTGGTSAVRTVASLALGGVPDGQDGVQLIAPGDADPPQSPGTTVYEAVIETSTASLPSGWYRCDVWLRWTFGRRVVSAGRLHLREPALT